MKYSQLFGRTVREEPKDAKLISHKLLYKAGFIRELVSGRYSILPLGLKVMDKIKRIIKEEMDLIGAQQLSTPTLHPITLWKKTNRTATMGPTLMRVTDRREVQFVLGATHEEVFVDLIKKFNLSQKDLPITLYQFSNKFRDELRARGGLVRVREFMMKDAYSFNQSVESLDKSYKDMYNAYKKIFDRLGIPTIAVEADSGAIGGKYSHEFMFEDNDGEDTFVQCGNCDYSANTEKAQGSLSGKNNDEKDEELEEIDAPRGVNMEAMADFYKLPVWRLLKTVVYKIKNKKSSIFIAVLVRGDLGINEVKLAKVLNNEDFEVANDDDLKKLNTVRGFVAPLDLSVNRFIVDRSVATVKNLITGANKLNRDTKNFNVKRDLSKGEITDIALVNEEFICQKCKKGRLKLKRGIEMGHVFRLDYYYSKPLEASFTAKDGSKQLFLMGCYGIGLERAMAAVVEKHHDEKGIIWPKTIAPYQVYLIAISDSSGEVKKLADNVYSELVKKGIEVLYDDRNEVSPGVKFADCDLIGIPVRLVVSEKTNGKVEVKKRKEDKLQLHTLEELLNFSL